MREEFFEYTLPNGIRLIHKQTVSPIAHCGILIDSGSRDETEQQHGIAHLIEHLFFKGTQKRKAYHILSRLDDVGGELNAYTTKEETCIHASFFVYDYSRAMELISDILFNSIFPEKEIAKEKEVVIDEINSYKDSPVELIFDEYEELLFHGNSIARGILGSEKTISGMRRQDLFSFIENNYCSSKMVFASLGNISFKRMVYLFEKFFSHTKFNAEPAKRTLPNGYLPRKQVKQKDTHQVHCMLGNKAYPILNEKRMALHVLNNLIAGPSLNSRVNLALREKHALAYNVESGYTAYSDTGLFYLYFGTDNKDLDKCLKYVHKEFDKLQKHKLGTTQLQRAKKQVMGQQAMAAENNESYMLAMAKAVLYMNRFPTLQETQEKFEAIEATDILEVANEILPESSLSYLIYK
jgi:predicted Zn-dependent peptidase